MKKLLIIGAGIGQMSIVMRAKKRGLYTIVVTIPGEWPCIHLADEVWYYDIYDVDGIYEKAKKENIDAVLTDQNDLTIPTVAILAEKLHLPGNSYSQVIQYCNKINFRETCRKIGNPVPRFFSVTELEMDFKQIEFQLPWIIKPADSQSSKGVRKVQSYEEAAVALDNALRCSKRHEAIIEEFFQGKEVVCEGFVFKGTYYNLGFGERKYFELDDLLIPSQTLFPANMNTTIQTKIIECETRFSKAVSAEFGIIHSEYLYNEKGEVFPVESAIRGGGVYISSDLIPLFSTIDINETLLDLALGQTVDIDALFAKKEAHAAGYVCFYLREGIIKEVLGEEEIQKLPFVHKIDLLNIHLGEETSSMQFKGDRKGPILVTGETREELDHNINVIKNMLKILVEKDSNLMPGIVWE